MAQIALSVGQKRKGWDFMLREQSRVRDIFGLTRGVYRDGTMQKNSFITTKKADPGEIKRTVSLIKDLVGAGRTGSQDLLGFEEVQATQEYAIFADELKHGVPYEKYGVGAFSKDPYKFISQINGQLADWHMKQEGRRIREALCNKFDFTLVSSTTQTGLTASNQYPNPNIFVVGRYAGAQPVYSATIATYATNVNTAVGTPGTYGSSLAIPTDLSFMDEISEWATTNRTIQGISGMGTDTMYVLTVPTHTVTKLYKLLSLVQQYTSSDAALKGSLGRVYRNLIVVEDQKAPRCAVTGASLTFSYWGVTDGRAAAAATTADVGFLLGAEALIEFVFEDLHYETETQSYGGKVGTGAFRTNGFNRVDWDDISDNGSGSFDVNSDNRRNYSSAVVLFYSI